jgi:hypothetical protein
MIKTNGPWFSDSTGRTIMLRGVNLGGSSKVPTTPNGATCCSEGFFDTKNVSFVGRPFLLEQADEHYSRLHAWGFNCLRFLITWEAIEHSGPGVYDEDYLDYLYQVVKKAGDYGFYVFIDPHQDVWSRFSGGDGAPGWTLECAGLDIRHFQDTGAAVVHQTHGDPFPRMIWPTNAYKLAAATMFTLFFAGNDFAPQTKVGGVPIQDFLQNHYLNSIKKVAEKLENIACVIGFDTLNEPQRGYIGVKDLKKQYGELDMGICPTPWQSILLGSGYPQKVNILERTLFGTQKKGTIQLNLHGESAWLPGRDCVWRENGVWDIDESGNPEIKNPDYFSIIDGKKVDFVEDYLTPFNRKVLGTVRSIRSNWLGFFESEVGKHPPFWQDAGEHNIVFSPHWYDGVALIFKRFNPHLAYDTVINKPVFGRKQIQKSFAKQLGAATNASKERLGNSPVLIGEIGIPYDMHNKKAYISGTYTDQIRAMNRSITALEDNLLSYTLWNYTADNTNKNGDMWNDEDLSIFSVDQRNNPNEINSGGRALEAVIRPFPVSTAGIPLEIKFDYMTGNFDYRFEGNPSISQPTEIFFPSFQYPKGAEITISDGTYNTDPKKQIIQYFAGEKTIHTIKIRRR